MILQCSECQARYMVPDQSLGASGRNVRCAKCGHTWFQAAAAESGEPLSELKDVLDEINAKPKPIPKGSNLPAMRRSPTPLGLRLSVATAAALAAAFLLLAVYPALFGLPSSLGLELADVGITRLSVDKHLVYEINGKITNSTEKPLAVPTLRINLMGEDNSTLQTWNFPGGGKILEPGANLPFTTGNLEINFPKATRFSVDLGNALELALRRKPE